MNQEQLKILKSGVAAWNAWRDENPEIAVELTDANLTGAKLRGANLTGANLTGADLTDANLTGAKLRGANLTGANLTGADLTDANLTDAKLRGANLTGANLTGADLWGETVGTRHPLFLWQFETWPVVITDTRIKIGCQIHAADEWAAFSDSQISEMDDRALDWWRKWRPVILGMYEAHSGVSLGVQEATR